MERNHNRGFDPDSELESQFILRLPMEPAKVLREAIRNNSTLKDIISLKIDNDLRHGEVRVDQWLMIAKVVDLPTVVESLKTIDGKGFYKTADICQMLLCRHEDDQVTDEDSPQKTKKKDSLKVEKKYLWPHGITPPTKNVRRRRFRKTLKKKYVEAPEIEKEVKRLLRIDNDAVSVKWEVLNEDDDNKVNKGTVIKKEPIDPNPNVAEHDIFGGAVSDSEEEDATLHVLELDETSQNSAEDSHLTDSNSVMNNTVDSKILTEFSTDMFNSMDISPLQDLDYYQPQSSSVCYSSMNLSRANIETRLEEVQGEIATIKNRLAQHESEIENIENHSLRQRFQEISSRLYQEQSDKEREQVELNELLKQII
ncbi:PREDICTED: transcription initiation factor TFIID subunit 7-like [Nicrophorus vespilloides]|uniref:Transcription initiation factor TFIID subunit 7-like n=1 Tax=Nicrophorus vespilloides TaxID=110193 RepID=A0ABM1M7E1_NICVS|nr:PREDICTED: transcription initiation factor TFIID subunit 7-like [Nicrophorus vespilloides]XP_017771381.1 PREDICTED: transcription initiation factor TFIID subunit 7-like [Nicrophorus vespilloides]